VGIAISIAGGNQWSPVVTFGATNYLVVWREGNRIYGARVSASGILLDTQAIAISIYNYNDWHWWNENPVVTFDGNDFLVVWESYYYDSWDQIDYILGQRVSQNGILLGPSPILMHNSLFLLDFPAVAFDGTNYLVAWQDSRNGYRDMYGTRVSQDGLVIDTSNIAISTAPFYQQHPAVAFDGIKYLVTWEDNRNGTYDIYGTRVDIQGIVLDTSGIAISTAADTQMYPAVTAGDTNYLVIWQDRRSGQNNDIYTSRVNPQGSSLDSAGIIVSSARNNQGFPATAFDGENYFAVWEDIRDSAHYDIYGARIDQSGMVLDSMGLLISTEVNEQRFSSAAFDGQSYFVVWADNRNDSSFDIYGARIDPSGATLDTQCISISTASDDQLSPAIAYDGTNYLVVWEDRRNNSYDIYGARVSLEGMVLDPVGIAICTAVDSQKIPFVAFDGSSYLVVWEDKRSGSSFDIYGARVSPDGTVLDPTGIAISAANRGQRSPSAAFDGTNYLVVWSDYRNYSNSDDIYGARVNTEGIILDPSGIAISTANYEQKLPSLSFDGMNYLVVWQDNRSGVENERDIYGARMTPNGVVLDPSGIDITHVVNNQCSPSVAFDGTNYVAIWQDYRNGFWDIYGSRITTEGMVIDSIDAFPVVFQPGAQIAPSLVRGPGNMVLITYSGFTYNINSHPANTMRIWGKIWPFIGIEEARYDKPDARMLCYPNPFFSHLTVKFQKDAKTRSELKIYDATGRLIKQYNGISGDQVIWDGKDAQGRQVPCGVYFVQLESDDINKQVKKVVLLK
jgi:hypothetical protein